MYYKIENTNSDLYKKLKFQREKEIEIGKRNLELIAERIPQEWDSFYGRKGQQNLNRVSIYKGFKFKKPSELPKNIWKEISELPGFYVPNKRTKSGREIANFLSNLGGSSYTNIFDILGIDYFVGEFMLPFVEIIDKTIVIAMDNRFALKHNDLIEITRTELDSILTKH